MVPRMQVRAYSKTMVTTSDGVGLVRMLVDAALRHVVEGQEAMREGRLLDKGTSVTKASDIVLELLSCLDFSRGGELALSLESLYIFVVQRISEANSRNDPELLEVVVKILRDLSLAWGEVASSDDRPFSA